MLSLMMAPIEHKQAIKDGANIRITFLIFVSLNSVFLNTANSAFHNDLAKERRTEYLHFWNLQ